MVASVFPSVVSGRLSSVPFLCQYVVKGRQPPEFAPEPEEADVDDFDAGDDEALTSILADALDAGGAETPVAAPAEQADEPRSAADAAATASEEANIKKLERMMALWLIYGRHPPKPAASAPGASPPRTRQL